MTVEITYDPKITNAKTQYNAISQKDMTFVQTELIRYMALMDELVNVRDKPEVKYAVEGYWRKKSKTLPKGKYGQNSPQTFTAGLLNNLMFGNQVDLSDIQMDAIRDISACMHVIYGFVKTLDIQANTKSIEPIIFKQKLFNFG
jgi:hypothetical protein